MAVSNENIRLSPDSGYLRYVGRTDILNGAVRFFYAGSSVTVRFVGTSISCVIRDHRFYSVPMLGAVVDGKMIPLSYELSDGDIIINIADGLKNEEHEIMLYKRQDCCHYFEFLGFILNEGAKLLEPAPAPELKIECYGDSVSAGAVVEATEYAGKNDPEENDGSYDNSWYSYAMITARNLGADIHNIAQGGIALLDNTGWYHAPDFIGMETMYNKTCPIVEDGYTDWDFSKYIPDVVLFAVGQNDPHNDGGEDFDITDPGYRLKWKTGYKKLISDLRSHYPDALIALLLTVLEHPFEWEDAIDEIQSELCDDKIVRFKFKRVGRATPGHPRLTEQYEMAEELTAELIRLMPKK